jgi:S1-C subfamily serine protease
VTLVFSGSFAYADLKGTLDKELSSLIKKTEPYLVTVKGDGSWRNLIATGIVYNQEGYVITSSPAYFADHFKVTFANGESYEADPVGVDHETGLAVLKIKGARQFVTPAWGSVSNLDKGDWVLFVGNSYDNPSAVNIGTFGGIDDDGLLALGLNVKPGSSGGAVLNTNGEVIGVLIAIEFSPDPLLFSVPKDFYFKDHLFKSKQARSNEKALALPIEQAKDIVAELIEHGEIKRGFLGISQKDLTESQKEDNDIDAGVMVIDVVDDSPADKAGLREEDIITDIDGDKIEGTGELYHNIRTHKPGDKITIAYIREGKREKVDVELAESERDYFLGSLDSREFLPKLKVDNKLFLKDAENLTEDLEKQLKDLRDEFRKLQDEMQDLRDELRD